MKKHTRYYLFNEACASVETGPEFPQIQRWKPGYDETKADSYDAYYKASNKGEHFPDFEPDLNTLILHSRAKFTDLISSGFSIGYIVSKQMKNVFEDFVFPPHRFYPVKISHKKKEPIEYFLIHLLSKHFEDYLDDIDYSRSSFYIADIALKPLQTIALTSKNNYLSKVIELQQRAKSDDIFTSIQASTIYFTSNFDSTLDFFKAPFGINYFISERLKDALFEHCLTGFEVQSTGSIQFNNLEMG
ncbi:hypothetical protein [Mucilaginibacter sp.]